MIGYYIVEGFTGQKDSAGYDTQIKAANKMDMNIKNILYLPPYLRKSQCNISIGDTVFGIVDDVTGIGCALFGENSADFKYFFDADVTIKKNLTVSDDITSTTGGITATLGDVIATTISLKTHTHPILTMQSSDAAQVLQSEATGNPAVFTAFATTVPM